VPELIRCSRENGQEYRPDLTAKLIKQAIAFERKRREI
jgi:hypothetical protein